MATRRRDIRAQRKATQAMQAEQNGTTKNPQPTVNPKDNRRHTPTAKRYMKKASME